VQRPAEAEEAGSAMRLIAKSGRMSRLTRIDCEWGFRITDATQVLVEDWSGILGFRFSEALVEVAGVETIKGVRSSFIREGAPHWQP
jgi:hypothetical protein